MRKSIVKNKWQYSTKKNKGEGLKGYGYSVTIYKNNRIEHKPTTAFPTEQQAEYYAEDYFLAEEFNIEKDY